MFIFILLEYVIFDTILVFFYEREHSFSASLHWQMADKFLEVTVERTLQVFCDLWV